MLSYLAAAIPTLWAQLGPEIFFWATDRVLVLVTHSETHLRVEQNKSFSTVWRRFAALLVPNALAINGGFSSSWLDGTFILTSLALGFWAFGRFAFTRGSLLVAFRRHIRGYSTWITGFPFGLVRTDRASSIHWMYVKGHNRIVCSGDVLCGLV
jgi:hypothetical protein